MMTSNLGLGSDSSSLLIGNSGDISEENNSEYYGAVHNNRPRYPGLYVGNLTWWTTDQDVLDAISSFGIKDVQEVKFFENRNNGQSRGFCVVTFSSEASLPIVKDRLPKIELHGQKPIVTPYTRQNLSLFESQNKATRPQINNSNNSTHAAGIMGISSISGVHAGTQGLPYSGLNSNYNQGMAGGPMGGGGMGGGGIGGMGGMGGMGGGGPRGYGMRMRGPRPGGFRAQMQNSMSNGPSGLSAPGSHQMNRMRFPPPPSWDNTQSLRHDEMRSSTASSSAPLVRHDDGRNSRNIDDIRSNSRHDDDIRSSSSRHDDGRSSSAKLLDDRDRLRRDELSMNSREERSSRGRDEGYSNSSSSRRVDRERSPSRRDDRSTSSSRRDRNELASSSSRRDERSSSRREEKSSSSSSRRHHHDRERDHRSRSRSGGRSRNRSKDRSRDSRDRRDRDKKDRY